MFFPHPLSLQMLANSVFKPLRATLRPLTLPSAQLKARFFRSRLQAKSGLLFCKGRKNTEGGPTAYFN